MYRVQNQNLAKLIPDPRSIAKSLRIRDYKVSLDLAITQWIRDQLLCYAGEKLIQRH